MFEIETAMKSGSPIFRLSAIDSEKNLARKPRISRIPYEKPGAEFARSEDSQPVMKR